MGQVRRVGRVQPHARRYDAPAGADVWTVIGIVACAVTEFIQGERVRQPRPAIIQSGGRPDVTDL